MSFRFAVWTLLALSFCLPAWAEVYQWRDAEGKVHFTDTPPPEGREIAEQRLQVNSIEGLAPQTEQRPKPDDAPTQEAVEGELNPGQLQQKALMQCSASVARMPTLISEAQMLGRKAVKAGKVSQSKLDVAMIEMDQTYRHLKRNERECMADYEADGESRQAVDCMADTQDVLGFGLCMHFADWAETFGD